MKSLAGKVALCTGSGRLGGLGHGMLRRLGDAGCRLVVSDLASVLNEGEAETPNEVVADLLAAGCDVLAMPCDVSDEVSVSARGCWCHGGMGVDWT